MLTVKTFTFNPVQENTYVLFNEKKMAVLVDPGFFTVEEEKTLWDFLESEKLTLSEICLTHAHFDHIFGLKASIEKFQLIPKIHIEEKEIQEKSAVHATFFDLKMDLYTGEFSYLNEKDIISIGDKDEFVVLFTPGHSPGSLSFYSQKDDFVISGDCLFRESVGRTDLPHSNPEILNNSIKQTLYRLPDNTVVYPGHGPTTTIGYEKKHNPFVRED